MTHYSLLAPAQMAEIKFTAATQATACQVYFPHSFFSSMTHPMAMKPLCIQSSSKRMARSIVMGAWMKRASMGRLSVGG